MQKCLTHAVALNEKAPTPTVPGKQTANTHSETHTSYCTPPYNVSYIGFVYNSTDPRVKMK